MSGDIQADVLLATDAGTFERYKNDDLRLAYTPADVESLDQNVVDPVGFYMGTRIIPTVTACNTNLVDTPPTSWQELTNASYAEQITN